MTEVIHQPEFTQNQEQSGPQAPSGPRAPNLHSHPVISRLRCLSTAKTPVGGARSSCGLLKDSERRAERKCSQARKEGVGGKQRLGLRQVSPRQRRSCPLSPGRLSQAGRPSGPQARCSVHWSLPSLPATFFQVFSCMPGSGGPQTGPHHPGLELLNNPPGTLLES